MQLLSPKLPRDSRLLVDIVGHVRGDVLFTELSSFKKTIVNSINSQTFGVRNWRSRIIAKSI